jgi:hypothetical protein
MAQPPGGGGRRPAQPGDLDASSLELVLRALGAVAAADEPAQSRSAAEQRAPVFNWNEEEEAVAKPAAAHKDGERSPSRVRVEEIPFCLHHLLGSMQVWLSALAERN